MVNRKLKNVWSSVLKLSLNVRKRIFGHVRLTETQISRAVCSEYSLSARRNFASLAIQNALREDYDQTAHMRRLIIIFAGCTRLFLMLRLKYALQFILNS